MNKLLLPILALCFVGTANAAILCESLNGGSPYIPATLSTAATSNSCRNTSVVVTSALSAVQSNISSATVHAWPSDRALKVEKGGSIANTTGFTINGPFSAGLHQAFAGSGAVIFGSADAIQAEWFGTSDYTASLTKAIAAATDGGIIKTTKTAFSLGALTINKNVTIDFNGATIMPSTTGVMISISNASPDGSANRTILKNAYVVVGTANPSDLIKIGSTGANTINTTISNFNVQGVTATHSLIWNLYGYGLKITDCKFRFNNSPAVIYLSMSAGDVTYSYALDVDHIDISNHTGIGIIAEGGSVVVHGMSVIENCSLGGIKHLSSVEGGYFMYLLSVRDCYMEGNSVFDISINQGNLSVNSTKFIGSTTYNKIYITSPSSVVTAQGNFYQYGGVNAVDQPTAQGAQYVGVGNVVSQGAAGFTGTFDREVSNTVRGYLQTKLTTFASNYITINVANGGATGDILINQPISLNRQDEYQITSAADATWAFGENIRLYVFRYASKINGRSVVEFRTSTYPTDADGYLTTVSAVDNTDGTYKIRITNNGGHPAQYFLHYVGSITQGN